MKNRLQKNGCTSDRQELDIIEAVGMQKQKNDFRNVMHSNTHYQFTNCDGKTDMKSVGGNCPIVPAANEAFHTYGCWWKDANTLLFYLDGEYKFTINHFKPSPPTLPKPTILKQSEQKSRIKYDSS